MSLFAELKRRNVIRVGIFYVVLSWLILQVADVIFGVTQLPDWSLTLVAVLLGLGFVPALIFAWVFELTPEGIKLEKDVDRDTSVTPETARRLDIAVLVMLAGVAALTLLATQRGSNPADAEALKPVSGTPKDEGTSVAGATPTADRRVAIAALPFSNLSGSEDALPFTNGLHDDLLTQLARIEGLRVISRTSVMDYRNTTKNMREIGVELGVTHLLEGGVQRAGDRVRINVQLIDAQTDEHLWAQTYDRELTVANIFDIQTGIAGQIAAALRVNLGAAAQPYLERGTDNLAAYEAYLRGKIALDDLDTRSASINAAEEALLQAVKLDPEFAEAHAMLANVADQRYWFEGRRIQDREQALAHVRTAESIQPDLPQIQQAYAMIYYHGFLDYDRALNHLDRVEESLADDWWATITRAAILRRSGDIRGSTPLFEQALELNPRTILTRLDLHESYRREQRFDDSRGVARSLQEFDVPPTYVLAQLGETDWWQSGDATRFIELVDRYGPVDTDLNNVVLSLLINALWNAGRTSDIAPYLESIERQQLAYEEPLALLRARYEIPVDAAELETDLERLQGLVLAGYQEPYYRIWITELLLYLDRPAEARSLLESLLVDPVITRDRLSGYDMVAAMLPLMVMLDDLEAAFANLAAIVQAEQGYSVACLVKWPHMEPIVEDPRFQGLVDRFGMALEDRSEGVPW